MKDIDNWVEYSSKEVPLSSEAAQASVGQNSAHHGLSPKDYQASFSLMMNVAHADGILVEAERAVARLALKGKDVEKRLSRAEAIERIKRLGVDKSSEFIDWCFHVASADGILHSQEIETLQRYCQALDIDFSSKARQHGIEFIPA